MSKCRRSRELTPRDVTARSSISRIILLQNRHRRAEPSRAERSGVAPAAIVPAARAPLSSNYRSNGASRYGDPTPASICRLALIQLPRRQLPRWYTCGRFIASVMPVRLFAPSLSLAHSFDLPLRLALYPVLSFSLCPVRFASRLSSFSLFVAADARSAVPRSAYTAAHDTLAMKKEKR